MNTYIRQTTINGKVKFILTINHSPQNGDRKRERLSFNTFAEAEFAQKEVEARYAKYHKIYITASRRKQIQHGVEMAQLKALGVTLTRLIEFWQMHHPTKDRTRTLQEMIAITNQTKTASRRRPRYRAELESTLNRFAKGRESMPLNQITPALVTEYLANLKGRGGGPAEGSTIKGVITRLCSMFSVACKNNTYLEAGANLMSHVEMPYVDSKAPVILTPNDAIRLLWVCWQTDLKFLPYLVLGLFGGVRPEELEKLPWRDIHFEECEVVIEEGVSKTERAGSSRWN